MCILCQVFMHVQVRTSDCDRVNSGTWLVRRFPRGQSSSVRSRSPNLPPLMSRSRHLPFGSRPPLKRQPYLSGTNGTVLCSPRARSHSQPRDILPQGTVPSIPSSRPVRNGWADSVHHPRRNSGCSPGSLTALRLAHTQRKAMFVFFGVAVLIGLILVGVRVRARLRDRKAIP
jgi:hypothetical protein